MSIFKPKSNRLKRINAGWCLNDWTTRLNTDKGSHSTDQILGSEFSFNMDFQNDPFDMVKTRDFIHDSLTPAKDISGSMIIGSAQTEAASELKDILVNIQPLGWIYVPGGRKK